jgi:hypothetical protein
MIKYKKHENFACKPMVKKISEFYDFFTFNISEYESYEQYWLAFVMKEKYLKIWNGKEWVAT